MRILPLTLALLLALTAPLQAQIPVQDTIPQLKEWWRADDMQYGKYGMRWLDNFYNGKGALVVWTPQGVKTWLLRFPGDTMNVFTWEKGSSNIKSGDFNGDGITDYIDENSNIYEGIKNGEPPKSESIACGQIDAQTNYPEAITDLNGDGNDDIINTPTVDHIVSATEITVCFGKQGLKDMTWQTVKIKDIDSNNTVLSCYPTANHELRLVCRRYFWYYNVQKQKVIQRDGYRLVRVWWDGNAFKSEILDEFTNDVQNGSGWFWQSALLPQTLGKNYLVGAIIIKSGNLENTDVIIYDLSNDKIEKLHSNRINTIAGFGINSLKYGIDSIAIPSLCICQYNIKNEPVLHIYSGNISKSLQELAQFKITQYPTLPVTGLISVPDVTGDEKSDIALSNRFTFTLLNSKSTSSIIEEQKTDATFSLQVLPPMPALRSQAIQLKITTSKLGNYSLSLYDSVGKKVFSNIIQIQGISENFISLDLSKFAITSGKYTLRLEGNGKIAQCSIIIN